MQAMGALQSLVEAAEEEVMLGRAFGFSAASRGCSGLSVRASWRANSLTTQKLHSRNRISIR